MANLSEHTCPICFDLLFKPVSLPCRHALCLSCFVRNREESNLSCPMCRTRISTWVRHKAKRGMTEFVDSEYDLFLATSFPSEYASREKDESDTVVVLQVALPTVSPAGSLRAEYEAMLVQANAERQDVEAEDEALARRVLEEEQATREGQLCSQHRQMVEDEELARKLHTEWQQHQPVPEPIKKRPAQRTMKEFVVPAASTTVVAPPGAVASTTGVATADHQYGVSTCATSHLPARRSVSASATGFATGERSVSDPVASILPAKRSVSASAASYETEEENLSTPSGKRRKQMKIDSPVVMTSVNAKQSQHSHPSLDSWISRAKKS